MIQVENGLCRIWDERNHLAVQAMCTVGGVSLGITDEAGHKRPVSRTISAEDLRGLADFLAMSADEIEAREPVT